MDESIVRALVDKLPPLDLDWPVERQERWWRWFERLWSCADLTWE